jgi:hypothetical protein
MTIPAPSAIPRTRSARQRWRFTVVGGLVAVIASYGVATALHADAAETLLSQGKPATASSTENAGTPASAAVDGNTGTRWSSAFSDPQWLQVDLGASSTITRVSLQWETARAATFKIQVSPNGTTWTDATAVTNGADGTQSLTLNATGRYVRMDGLTRNTGYGYSLWEFQVFGGSGGTTPTTPPVSPTGPAVPGGGSLGANVIVFNPSQSTATIQSQADTIFRQQESNQFGTQRYVLAFQPGTYNGLNIQVGFYTSVVGLGQNPDDVRINGDITVDAGWMAGNATQNFWRSVENLSLYPVSGADRWAVSQAAPFRRIDVHGDVNLAPNGYGWASGGYIADSKISGVEGQYSQQQWFTRNSNIGSNSNAVWNQVFVGTPGAPASSFPNPPYTTIGTTPTIREKPYLYQTGGNYAVFVPNLRTNSSGTSWPNTPGTSIPLSQFYVAKPGDSAATINNALAQGLNLIFQPGIYHVSQTINVNRANTVVLGLGYATIIPDNGVTPMQTADVDGVKIAGLLFDAGATNSANLLVVGPNGSSANHAGNPTTIQDVFFRIGGAGPGKATNSLLVNSPNTIIDHIWAWRADHGSGVGWTVNTADSGLIVNGANVTAYGLFVEHYQKYEVVWNANGGRTYFLQNEQPYDPPNNATWRSGANGYAAYKVADSVTSHEAWGLGSYCFFQANPAVHSNNGFEVPVNGGVKLHNIFTISLASGTIDHIVNNTGPAATASAVVPQTIVNFP